MESALKSNKVKVLFFDINETILDLTVLKSEIDNLFGQDIFDLWFTKLLHKSLILTIAETFESFTEIALSTLTQIATTKKVDFTDDMFIKVTEILSSLPPYPDVTIALDILRQKGYRIVALSNSSKDLLNKQLANAQIAHLFNEQLSVELFYKYKLHKQVYQEAARMLNTQVEECMLIATHDWDVFGALNSGLRAALVKRVGKGTYSLSIKPDLEVENLFSLAEKL